MSKVSNVLTMLEYLSSGRKYNIKELSEKLEVSPRMVRVYKDELEKIKTITNAELNSANTPQSLKDVHYKAQQYAYALTTHLSQGGEYPTGIYYEEYLRSDIQNQLNYTGITRFKQYLVYCKKTRKYYAFQ